MTTASPLALTAGIVLIAFGVIYPMAALLIMNRQLSRGTLTRNQIVASLVLSGLLPLTAILAGFWLLSPRAQGSSLYLGALIGSAFFLLVTLVARWRLTHRT